MSYLPTDSAINEMIAKKVSEDGNYNQSVLTYFEGKIYHADARDGKLDDSKIVVNVPAFMEHRIKGAQGKLEEAAKIDPFTDYYKYLLDEHDKMAKKLSGLSLSVSSIAGAAASGNNVIETPYELTRRINALIDVVGPKYNLLNFNSLEVVNVRPVDQLNFVGFTKNGLVEGTPEIGDHIVPQPVRQAFTAFDKAIFADSFRYEFSTREKKDNVFSLEQEMLADIPGAMAKMKSDKITTPLNAMASLGDLTPDWDAVTGNFYTADAAFDIETDDNALNSLGGATHWIAPRDVVRLYKRNVQSAIAGTPAPSMEPAGERMGRLPLNDHITYVVNNTIATNTAILIQKGAWADFYQGPTINIAYQNKMTPGQVMGSLLFDFNGFKEKLATGAKKRNGFT